MVKRPVVLNSFYLISLLRESGRHSKSSVKAVAIFPILAVKSTLITVPCNDNVSRLLLQQLRCYLSPLDVVVTSILTLDRFLLRLLVRQINVNVNCLVMNARSLKGITKTAQQTSNPCVTSIASRTWCTPKTLTLYASMRNG